MIDIVDIKSKVKNKELEFYLLNGNIYCQDNKTNESVNVGVYKQIEVEEDGTLIIRKNGWLKKVED